MLGGGHRRSAWAAGRPTVLSSSVCDEGGAVLVTVQDASRRAISYNSCRNRNCPKCQAAAAKEWLGDRRAELLPVPYFPS